MKTSEFSPRLAIDGGRPVRTSPWSPWPRFEQDEVDAACRVLASGRVNYWTGDEGRKFEQEFAHHVGRGYAVVLANGTVALELALFAFGIGPGDEVLTASRTYIASASCAVARGAIPAVADVDPDSQVVTAGTLRAALTPRTRAIIPVHLAGWPCPMDEIMDLARERDLVVIEDCAQAHGARYRGRPVGSFGHAAAFSFCQDKIMTTGGEGGMLVLDDERAWERAWAYKDIGRSYDAVYRRNHPLGFRWVTETFGTNWRMTEMQAAIGRIQLKKLDRWVEARQRNASLLAAQIEASSGLRVPRPGGDTCHSRYRLYAFVRPDALKPGWSRDRIMAAISAEGVPCSVGSCSEIYLEKAFRDAGYGPRERLPIARQLGETSLAFLVHPTLSINDMQDMGNAIMKVMTAASWGG